MDSIHDSISQLMERAKGLDSQGTTVLFLAAAMEYSDTYTQVLRLILEQGAVAEPTDPRQPKPFSLVLYKGDLEAVELMIDHGIELKNYVNESPLHKAAYNPRLEVLEFLLRSELFNPNGKDKLGETALKNALRAQNPGAVELLLQWGMRPNSFDNGEYTPLQCVNYDDETKATTECIEILLRYGADPDGDIKKGKSALLSAASSKHNSEQTKRVRLFLEHGAGQKDEEATYQVLDTLISYVDLETLQLYMKQQNIDLSKCKGKWTLSSAIWNRHPYVLEFLLKTGVFDVTRNDGNGMNVLYLAVLISNPEAAELLLDWGVDVDNANNVGHTPLYVAAIRADMDKTNDTSTKCVELLFLHGADINSKHFGPYTAFEMALPYGITSWTELPEIPPVTMAILAQANLFESQGKHLNSKDFHQREAENKLCQDELRALKSEILGDSVTLYTILANGTSRFYSEKSKLMQKLHDCKYVRSLENRFPIYGRRLVKIIEHVNLREVAAERVSCLVGLQRDNFYLIVEKIVRMLFVRDLRTLNRL